MIYLILAQGSVTKMKNLTRMMSSFLTFSGLCACLCFFLRPQYTSAHSSFKCLLVIVEMTQRGPKMHRVIRRHLLTSVVLFSQRCDGFKTEIHSVTIESTFSSVAKFHFPKERSRYFSFCLTPPPIHTRSYPIHSM